MLLCFCHVTFLVNLSWLIYGFAVTIWVNEIIHEAHWGAKTSVANTLSIRPTYTRAVQVIFTTMYSMLDTLLK